MHRAIARCEAYLSKYIAYISVSKPTPWAVAGPHGQLASIIIPNKKTAGGNNCYTFSIEVYMFFVSVHCSRHCQYS